MINVKIDPNDWNRLFNGLNLVAQHTRKSVPDLLRQTAYFMLVSAAKATKPGTTSKLSSLPKKARFRPLVSIPSSKGFFNKNSRTGFIFKTDRPIKKASSQGLERISKGIKFFNKKTNSFDYIPYSGATKETDKKFKIPYAGAAKGGYLGALHSIGNTKGTDTKGLPPGKKYSTVWQGHKSADEFFIAIINEVEYAAKIAPQSADIGLKHGLNRSLKLMDKKLDEIARRF